MPCRVSSDAHEWNNESPTVPAYNPVKPHKVDEQSIIFHWGEKTPWSFTAACACSIVRIAQGIWEPCLTFPGMSVKQRCNTRLSLQYYLSGNTETCAGGQFGWGGTPLKGYQRGPKFSSSGSEIR